MSKYELIMEMLSAGNPESLTADGLNDALIGYTMNSHHVMVAVYDHDKCLDVYEAAGMTRDEADEYMDFNVLGAYVGENGPLFIKTFEEPE